MNTENESLVLTKNSSLILTSIIYIGIGIAFVFVPANTLLWLTFILLGSLMIICNIPTLIEDLSNLKTNKKNVPGLIFTLLCITLGIVLIFWKQKVLLICVGIFFIAFPLFKLIIAENKKKQLRYELPKMILGAIAIILGPENTMNVVFKIIGIIIILAGILYAICTFLLLTKYKEKSTRENVIDEKKEN